MRLELPFVRQGPGSGRGLRHHNFGISGFRHRGGSHSKRLTRAIGCAYDHFDLQVWKLPAKETKVKFITKFKGKTLPFQ